MNNVDLESTRLQEDASRQKNWKRWGPYLSERQWGTVREDYSADGDAWNYLPHDHARSRAYRWGEDGLMGFCDRECRLCFSLALWNGQDAILKERLFGLTNGQGNHGEDVKECYYYLDSTPTHSYCKALYKYPQAAFPYAQLEAENARRNKGQAEYELLDSDAFDEDRYFDVFVEYAKAAPDDILIRLTIINRGPHEAELHVLPQLWFRNSWSWGREGQFYWPRPRIEIAQEGGLLTDHETLNRFRLQAEDEAVNWLFTENETNDTRLFNIPNPTPYVKDAFHRFVVNGQSGAVNPDKTGTKAAAHFQMSLQAGETRVLKLRLFSQDEAPDEPFGFNFDATFEARLKEANVFYDSHAPQHLNEDERRVVRQAHAGMFWSKQFYHFIGRDWLQGDPSQPTPPLGHQTGRNAEWANVFCSDVLSMPDKWEYPWFASWDSAFHTVVMAHTDPEYAKAQLILFLREWYQHPNGQIPAYEWNFSDVNPPVHAWAAWRVYKTSAPRGQRDRLFLERVFQKLLLNFTWWVNRKDPQGNNLFAGGFLGLDNIGVFDRNVQLPQGGHLEQADGTAWMAFFCLTMLSMALELAREDPCYEDIATKFFEHFVAISDAMNTLGGSGLWDEEDGFYYDQIMTGDERERLRLRSLVGTIPLIAVEVLDDKFLKTLPGFSKRMRWFLDHQPKIDKANASINVDAARGLRLLAIPSRARLERVLKYLLDETEFLSDYGVRSLSRVYGNKPFVTHLDDQCYDVYYTPGESTSGLFGGNSNWRGPIWFPINFLIIEALERYARFYGDSFQVECPAKSGQMMTLRQTADEIARRLTNLFKRDNNGVAPWQDSPRYAQDPNFRDLTLFHEYFDGDSGRGLGASHQTGWTALVARLLENVARDED